jgi:hypothetical protein
MSLLELLAECSIALTGFGAILAALRGSDSPRGVFRAWTIVSQAGIAFLLSLVPLVLSLGSMTTATLWHTASAIGVVATSATVFSTVTLDRRFSRFGFTPQAIVLIRSAQACCIIALLGMLSNALGWPWSPGLPLYAIAIVLLVVSSLIALLHSFLVPLQLTLADVESRGANEEQDQS